MRVYETTQIGKFELHYLNKTEFIVVLLTV
jgi:hypothetical protein